jgi:hypothetical protein
VIVNVVVCVDSRPMELDRQERPEPLDASGRRLVPQRVPETKPTPLQDWFIYLSIIVLICGTVAISALELGAQASDLIVRLPVALGAAVLSVVTVDAVVRVWRSAWAWLPVNRNRGLFRFVWAAVLVGVLVASVAALGWALLVG